MAQVDYTVLACPACFPSDLAVPKNAFAFSSLPAMTDAQPPSKRRRKSRFAPSSSSTLPPIPSKSPPNSTSLLPSNPPLPNPVPPPNSSVATLRARLSPSNASAVPPAKRRRASRFAPVADNLSSAPASTTPAQPPVAVDLVSIPVTPVSTIRINRHIAQAKKLDNILNVTQADLLSTDPGVNPHYHAGLTPARDRPKKELVFHTPGDIAQKAERRREQREVELKRAEYRKQLLQHANDDDVELPMLPRAMPDVKKEIPIWEWWDVPFLRDEPEEALANCRINEDGVGVEQIANAIHIRDDRITHYMHCPPPLQPLDAVKEPPVVPLMLTKKETKKLRRQRRMEKMKEKQEMIATGLLPIEAPKVKLSNMVRVLANESTADPTKVEAEVRKQVEERRKKHETDNQARKRTKEERRDKAVEKLEQDKEGGLMATVYRIVSMDHPQHRFKVDINARQWQMTGVLMVFPEMNIIVVEGGAKALRKYKKLMLRRIDWNAKTEGPSREEEKADPENGPMPPANEEEETDEGKEVSNTCVLVWEGPIAKPAFNDFSTTHPRNSRECRQILRRHGVEHYWDLCLQGNPLGNRNLGQREID